MSSTERYSHRALSQLHAHGHEPIPVHPALEAIEGIGVVPTLRDVAGEVDTLTLYVKPAISEPLAADIVALRPGRVIFNPGTESTALRATLEEAGIRTLEACTLVLLSTGQFDEA